jgi:uncharacterized flavoprotein (TIGR03862 family)
MPPESPSCAIVGAGPAGLMAAEVLAQAGARVTIYEAKASPARKFLMAGRGGLNLTHSEDLDIFLGRYSAPERLASYIRAFPPQGLRDFCAQLGEETFVGSSGRVFPRSFKASPLLRSMLRRLERLGVTIETRTLFEGFAGERTLVLRANAEEPKTVAADAIVLALGGASWPRLGSTGDWVKLFAERDIRVAPLAPANCGAIVDWSEPFLHSFEGGPIKTIALTHRNATARGDMIVTRIGLEGGPVYSLATGLQRTISENGEATLHVDLKPDTTLQSLTKKFQRPRGKQSLSSFLRKAGGLSKIGIALMREIRRNEIPTDLEELARLVKNIPVRVRAMAGFERAISTAGGVAFEELDENLMLRKAPGVFIAGEMLDFDAPTGGYLLQAAFSTGYAAGAGAARYVGLKPDR